MNSLQWRRSETANTDRDTGAEGLRVRELRQAGWHTHANQTKEEKTAGKAEAEQAKRLAFSLSASLAFRSLPLLAFPGESLPGETTARDLRAHDSEALGVRELAPVVSERLFIEVAEQVERFNADVCAMQLPLHKTPEILHRIRVDIASNVFDCVVYDLMPVVFGEAVIRLQSVSKQCRTCRNVLPDVGVKFMLATCRNGKRADVTAALHHAESDSLVRTPGASNDTLTLCMMHIPSFPADERFVNFNFTGQLGSSLVLHRLTNPMEHEPCGLLSNSKIAGDFTTANAIPAVGNQPHGCKPLIQTNRRFVKHGADLDGELFTARRSFALPDSARPEEHRFLGSAVRTLHAVRPSLGREVLQ